MTNRYIIHFNPLTTIEPYGPGWQVINNATTDDIFSKANIRFQNNLVILVQYSANEQNRVLSTAHHLLDVGAEVKIFDAQHGVAYTEESLLNAPTVSNVLLEMDTEDFESLTIDTSMRPIHPAQDYDGDMYYGGCIQGQDKLVTSGGEFFPLAGAQSRGILLLQNQLSISQLRQQTVIEFITGVNNKAPDVVFAAIREYIHRHIYFTEPETYDLVAVWIMGTYIFRAFRYYPYLHLNAEKGSGKTLLMELMAPVSFNGMLLAQPAASTVIKLIDQNSATLFIDEAEGLSSGNHQILKTGFARSGIFYAGEKMYRTYSPKCFAGINAIDDVLADRAITIKMMRKTGAECIELYRENSEMRKLQQEIRDSLYLFGLRFGPAIAREYESGASDAGMLAHLSNRAYDIWAPLYRIVTSFSEGVSRAQAFTSLDKLSRLDVNRRRMRDSEENETGVLIQGLTDVLKHMQPLQVDEGIRYYDPDVLYRTMIEEEKIPHRIKRKGFSRLIKRILDIDSVPRAFRDGTKRMYAVDMVKFEEYQKRYGESSIT